MGTNAGWPAVDAIVVVAALAGGTALLEPDFEVVPFGLTGGFSFFTVIKDFAFGGASLDVAALSDLALTFSITTFCSSGDNIHHPYACSDCDKIGCYDSRPTSGVFLTRLGLRGVAGSASSSDVIGT